MQSASSRIWTRVAVSISYDDNHLHHGHLQFFTDTGCYLEDLPETMNDGDHYSL